MFHRSFLLFWFLVIHDGHKDTLFLQQSCTYGRFFFVLPLCKYTTYSPWMSRGRAEWRKFNISYQLQATSYELIFSRMSLVTRSSSLVTISHTTDYPQARADGRQYGDQRLNHDFPDITFFHKYIYNLQITFFRTQRHRDTENFEFLSAEFWVPYGNRHSSSLVARS